MATGKLIEAAGGVLWRPAAGGEIEVAVVHRPKYDDWSIPKGKLSAGEHPLLAAVREVEEETGHTGRPGRPLGEIRYLKDGVPKRVRYWAMRMTGGQFAPNDEVDRMMWLPPEQAQRHLLPERDQGMLRGIDLTSVSTRPCILLPHGAQGSLDQLLAAYGVRQVTAADQVLDALRGDAPTAVVSERDAIPGLVTRICAALGAPMPDQPTLQGASLIALHLIDGPPQRIAAVERLDPMPLRR